MFIPEYTFGNVVCKMWPLVQISTCSKCSMNSLHWRNDKRDASQMTSVSTVCSTVGSKAGQRKYQSSASLAFVRTIHWWPVNSRHKSPVTQNIFLFDDVIMWYAVHVHSHLHTNRPNMMLFGVHFRCKVSPTRDILNPLYCFDGRYISRWWFDVLYSFIAWISVTQLRWISLVYKPPLNKSILTYTSPVDGKEPPVIWVELSHVVSRVQ